MAKSKARKLRNKLAREGKMNPDIKRSPFVFSDMRTRITKNKKDHLYRQKHKNHHIQNGNDGSFYFAAIMNCLIKFCFFRYSSCASSTEMEEKRITEVGPAWASKGMSVEMTVPILA